jgi:predicted signal transduction protein with EAL and GGDEF domain
MNILHWLSPLIHIAFAVAIVVFALSLWCAAHADSAHEQRTWLVRGAFMIVFGVFLLSLRGVA